MDPMAALTFAGRQGFKLGQGGALTGDIRAGEASGGYMDLVGNGVLGLLGLDYRGSDGAAQELEDVLDRASGSALSSARAKLKEAEAARAEWERKRRNRALRDRAGENPVSDEELQRLRDDVAYQYKLSKVEESDYGALRDNDPIREALGELSMQLGTSGQERALKHLADQAAISGDPKLQAAAQNIIEKVKSGAVKPEEMSRLLGSLSAGKSREATAEERQQAAAMAQKIYETQKSYGDIADRLSGMDGLSGAGQSFVEMIRRISTEENGLKGIGDAQLALSRLSDDERARVMAGMGDSTDAALMRSGAMSLARQRANLSGGGYRGQRGARDTMHQMFSGGLSDQLELVVDGKVINDRQGRRILDSALTQLGKGGELSKRQSAALQAYKDKFSSGLGVRAEDAEEYVSEMAKAMADGKISPEEADALQALSRKEITTTSGQTTTLGALQREKQLERQKASDPLSDTRNEYLKQILERNSSMDKYLKVLAIKAGDAKKDMAAALKDAGIGVGEASGEPK